MSAPDDAGTAIADFMQREKLGPDFAETVAQVYRPLAVRIETLARTHPGLIVGFCGSQGSGKSTGVAVLKILLEAEGLRAATLSIDDLYLSKGARQELADEVHPLLATRGPPGTHDVALGEDVLDALVKPQATSIPRFDKAHDPRTPGIVVADHGLYVWGRDLVQARHRTESLAWLLEFHLQTA